MFWHREVFYLGLANWSCGSTNGQTDRKRSLESSFRCWDIDAYLSKHHRRQDRSCLNCKYFLSPRFENRNISNWIKTQTKCIAWENWNPVFFYFKNQPQCQAEKFMKICWIWAQKRRRRKWCKDSLVNPPKWWMIYCFFLFCTFPSSQFQNRIL